MHYSVGDQSYWKIQITSCPLACYPRASLEYLRTTKHRQTADGTGVCHYNRSVLVSCMRLRISWIAWSILPVHVHFTMFAHFHLLCSTQQLFMRSIICTDPSSTPSIQVSSHCHNPLSKHRTCCTFTKSSSSQDGSTARFPFNTHIWAANKTSITKPCCQTKAVVFSKSQA